MALDESRNDDEILTDREVTYLVNKTLFEQVKPIAIDFISTPRGSGFKLSSALDAKGNCGTSCSC
jgi:Fe-S cluster assembly iron-binding protein IscA